MGLSLFEGLKPVEDFLRLDNDNLFSLGGSSFERCSLEIF